VVIGIRHEDKSRWEARAPLVPEDVAALIREHGVPFRIERSPHRAFPEEEYRRAGAEVADNLDGAGIVLGVKEIPAGKFAPGVAYLYFSHTIKGQPANMPALKRLMELGCTLIDPERIVDERNRRLVFFGRFAGLAGMIDTLWALGRRLDHEGVPSPFSKVRPAHEYADLESVKREFAGIAAEIRAGGLPPEVQPLVCGFTAYGQVSQGAQEIFGLLPVEWVEPERLPGLARSPHRCYGVVFREEHMVSRTGPAAFDLQEYYRRPDRYRASFFRHAPFLTMLVNGIYWEPRYPRFLTRAQFGELYSKPPRLRVVGDITCDIDGSLACTTRATSPDNPVYVYDPATGETADGVAGNGPVVLAVDFLPCELPVDASRHFSRSLAPFIPGLAGAGLSRPLDQSGLPLELQRATIVHRGKLTESYGYLAGHLRNAG